MNIPDFDVEPVVGPRFWAVVLGVVSAVTGVLAVIGWPIPVISGHSGSDRHAWARSVRGVQDWLAYDGWRMSGTSWVWGAFALAALAGVLVIMRPDWPVARPPLVVGPAGAVLVLGPVVQWALGLPWSNYQGGSAGGTAFGIVVTLVGGAVIMGLRRAARRSARRDPEVNPPPRGVR